jgi:preprotein translocase subunit SecA
MKGELYEFMYQLAALWYEQYHEEMNLEGLKDAVRTYMLCEVEIQEEEFKNMQADACIDRILDTAKDFLERKEQQFGTEFMSGLEHYAFLRSIDDKWREHLMIMDELKEGIHLRAYGQKDPLLEYKGEALHAFQGLIQEIQKETVSVVFRYYPQVVPSNIPVQTDKGPLNPRESNLDHPSVTIGRSPSLGFFKGGRNNTSSTARLRAIKPDIEDYQEGSQPQQSQEQSSPGITVRRAEPRIGRNEPCHCGSGKKYKHCHANSEESL